ncbi:MAG: GNAT family N-acetyltransferase [Lentisphaeraceae bacterium]|nr:GNAT family N-acetyltransferase [Lentisphaeraceae bacterium]
MIEYHTNKEISLEQFIDLLNKSTLGERRPIDDDECLQLMLDNADILVTAWDKESLVGLARSVTDFPYCCYLSDLAVDESCQKQGIGKELIAQTQKLLGPKCKLILLSAPAAVDYYPKIGFEKHPQCWVK